MRNIFMSKSAANASHLQDRWDRGSRNLEIHLRDFEPKDSKEVEKITNNIKNIGLNVFVIHSPMKRDFIVEALGTQKAKERIRLVSQLAANMHSIHQKQMVVVLHQELSLEQIISFGLIRGIKETFSELLVEFPMIDYAFENLTLFGFENGQVIISAVKPLASAMGI